MLSLSCFTTIGKQFPTFRVFFSKRVGLYTRSKCNFSAVMQKHHAAYHNGWHQHCHTTFSLSFPLLHTLFAVTWTPRLAAVYEETGWRDSHSSNNDDGAKCPFRAREIYIFARGFTKKKRSETIYRGSVWDTRRVLLKTWHGVGKGDDCRRGKSSGATREQDRENTIKPVGNEIGVWERWDEVYDERKGEGERARARLFPSRNY